MFEIRKDNDLSSEGDWRQHLTVETLTAAFGCTDNELTSEGHSQNHPKALGLDSVIRVVLYVDIHSSY